MLYYFRDSLHEPSASRPRSETTLRVRTGDTRDTRENKQSREIRDNRKTRESLSI